LEGAVQSAQGECICTASIPESRDLSAMTLLYDSLLSKTVLPSKLQTLPSDSPPPYLLQETGEHAWNGRQTALHGKEHNLPHEI